MNVRCLRRQVLGLLAAGMLVGGCKAMKQPRWDRTLTVTATQKICHSPVEVHLVGVNQFEKERWESMSMTDYWRSGNPEREGAKDYTHVIRFGTGPCERTLEKDHPIREKWESRSAEYLFVLAHLPGLFEDRPGNADARRLVMPGLKEGRWGQQREIKVVVDSGNVSALTTPEFED